MSYEIIFDPDGPGEAAFQVGTSRGWPEFGRWVGTLPADDYPDLVRLVDAGTVADASPVADQIWAALAAMPPMAPGVATTAEHLASLCEGSDTGESAIIISA